MRTLLHAHIISGKDIIFFRNYQIYWKECAKITVKSHFTTSLPILFTTLPANSFYLLEESMQSTIFQTTNYHHFFAALRGNKIFP